MEGGDILVPGNGVVLIGMSERSSRQAIGQVAAKLFAEGAAEQVIVAGMPRLRAAMHLDTIFTFADRDRVTCTRTLCTASTPSPSGRAIRRQGSRSLRSLSPDPPMSLRY